MYAKLHRDLSESDTMFTDGSVGAAKDSATLRVQMDNLGDQVRKDAWDNPDFFTYRQAMAKLDGTGRQPQCFRREDNAWPRWRHAVPLQTNGRSRLQSHLPARLHPP